MDLKEKIEERKSHQSANEGKISLSLFDLRTTNGQIIFILVTISISILVQLIPSDTFQNPLRKVKIPPPTPCPSCEPNIITKPIHPKYRLFGNSASTDHLIHVENVLNRFGMSRWSNETTDPTTDWDLLWAHDYPFRILYPQLHQLKFHQLVNHFPGTGFITNKVDFATTDLKYIPKSFRLPKDHQAFIEYAQQNPGKLFVQKHNQHRHILIRNVSEIDESASDTFIQEYIDRPLLVDGYKFDIGVYVILTSIDPLRLYIYSGDILFRYCPVKYHPFDRQNIDKYIIGDDYLPTWEVPSLSKYYNLLGFGMRDSFNQYLRDKNMDPSIIWEQVEDAIRLIVLAKEPAIINSLKQFPSKRNFFEMMRFDLVVDENLRVYLMEANMSPNLSSAHYQPNRLLYEQVIYNMFGLVGVGTTLDRESFRKRKLETEAMVSSQKNIAVDAFKCFNSDCLDSCDQLDCRLCRQCLTDDWTASLHTAYREHINRADTKRIFPIRFNRTMDWQQDMADKLKLSISNYLMSKWFYEKCKMESSWC